MDRQIKLRGFRIEPGQIEAAIEAKPGIDRVHTAIHHPNGATPTLVTWYSTTDGTARPASEMQDWAAQTLPAHMRPHCVHVVDWPMTPGGKIDTRALPAPSGDTPAQDTAEDTSSTPLTEEVARLFEQILGITGVRPETSFFQAGGDSLALLRLMPELETTFGVHLKPTAVYTDPTPRGVALALQKQDPDPLVVIQIQPEGTNPHIYGVHVLGDDGSYFRPMAAELGPDQPVFGLTVGLLTENTPTSVPDIARFYLHQIERHYPEGPLSLLAVSAGSYITLELAHQLLDAGREIEAFVLLDAEGPGGRPAIPPLARLGVHALQALRQGYPYVAKRLQGLREKRMQDRALRQMRKDVPVEEPIISPVDDFVAANLLAIEEYQPRPLPVPMTIFRAADNLFDTRGAIASGLGWSDIAAAGFELIDVPGDHLGILDTPNVATLAGHLRDILAKRRKES
jgi:thioesterase domain-containing protein/acyl carrier protein